MLHEAGQHATDFDHFLLAEHELAPWNYRGVSGELKMIFDLGRRRESNLQELREVHVRRTDGTLGDVRRFGNEVVV